MQLVKQETISKYKYDTQCGSVVIEFVENKFSRVSFSFQGTYTRENWYVLGDIATKIARLEAEEHAGKF